MVIVSSIRILKVTICRKCVVSGRMRKTGSSFDVPRNDASAVCGGKVPDLGGENNSPQLAGDGCKH